MSNGLTKEDVARLLSDPSPTTRAETAAKVAGQVERTDLSPGERGLVEDILRAMVRDAAVQVRAALADGLKYAVHVPHDIALDLAEDIEQVSVPMLEASTVLSDDDLIRLIAEVSEEKCAAIARRETVSEAVSDALIDTERESVVATLIANDGASVSEAAMHRVVDTWGGTPTIDAPLAKRAHLPLTVAERLVTLVSEDLQHHLLTHHDLTADTVTELVSRAREKATVGLAGAGSSEGEIAALVDQMAAGGRLGPSVMLRALCMGDIVFFEQAMARLAGVPVVNARVLIHDAGALGFKSLYAKAGLPDRLMPAFRTGLEVLHETDLRGADYDPARFSRTVMERILTQAEDLRADDVDYLLRKLTDLAPPEIAA
ncbi:MAG: DUF2336 domain-containing protein [Azospirillaceae bacterium]